MIARLAVCAILFLGLLPVPAFAAKQIVIPSAYVGIANENRVPPEILFIVSMGESGTKLTSGRVLPWPWTLNINQKGYYYRTRNEAYAALLVAIREKKQVDVSLGQVNWRWHAKSFKNDPWLALEPYENLRVASRLLRSLYEEDNRGDWWTAVGKYHSPGNKPDQRARAQSYSASARARYNRLFGGVSPVAVVASANG